MFPDLADVLDQVELRTSRRQRQQGKVGHKDEVAGAMPSSLIKGNQSLGATGDMKDDLLEVHFDCRGVAARHGEAGDPAFSGRDSAEYPC